MGMESLASSNGVLASTNSTLGEECGLTLRSSEIAPAWRLARDASRLSIRLEGQSPYRRSPPQLKR
jgi:hypothetical protein